MLNDTLANAFSCILNSEKTGKTSCMISPCSKVIKTVLDILNEEGYVGKYEAVTSEKGGFLKLNLIGKINNCQVVKPRFKVKNDEFKKFEKRYLLADGFGILIVSTDKGIMTHTKAKEKNLGGRMIAYCY